MDTVKDIIANACIGIIIITLTAAIFLLRTKTTTMRIVTIFISLAMSLFSAYLIGLGLSTLTGG